MRPSDEKVSAMVQRAFKALEKDRLIRVLDPEEARRSLRRAIDEVLSLDEAIEAAAEAKIQSLSRRVLPGSREWADLHARYVSEERRKRGL